MDLAPATQTELTMNLTSNHYFTFTVVRHPLDRLLSAFRDKFLNQPCKWQSQHFTPLILKMMRPDRKYTESDLKLRGTGCIKVYPTFYEFVEFVIRHKSSPDTHWLPMTKVNL